MNEVYLLSCSLVAAGLYIVYLHSVIRKYAQWMRMASYALMSAYDSITGKGESDETTAD